MLSVDFKKFSFASIKKESHQTPFELVKKIPLNIYIFWFAISINYIWTFESASKFSAKINVWIFHWIINLWQNNNERYMLDAYVFLSSSMPVSHQLNTRNCKKSDWEWGLLLSGFEWSTLLPFNYVWEVLAWVWCHRKKVYTFNKICIKKGDCIIWRIFHWFALWHGKIIIFIIECFKKICLFDRSRR